VPLLALLLADTQPARSGSIERIQTRRWRVGALARWRVGGLAKASRRWASPVDESYEDDPEARIFWGPPTPAERNTDSLVEAVVRLAERATLSRVI
jgi:hypothetical protein